MSWNRFIHQRRIKQARRLIAELEASKNLMEKDLVTWANSSLRQPQEILEDLKKLQMWLTPKENEKRTNEPGAAPDGEEP